MMAWKIWLIGLALAGGTALGCRQQSFLTEADFHDARNLAYPSSLDADPASELVARPGTLPPPATVDDTERKIRYLSLREAVAIALENGTVGLQSVLTPGSANDLLGGFAARTVQGADGIRVLAFDPAIVANDIEASLAKFDTLWTSSLTWSRTDTPLGISPTTFTQTGPSIASINSRNLNFSTSLLKPLPTGGVAGITFGITSQKTSPGSPIDPAIQPSIQFQFEQPLLLGFGDEINQLRDAHPGSLLTPFSTLTGVEGILITRIRLDQQRAEFERNLNYLLLNVEAAYWNLYGAYYQLYSREEGMRYAYESWRLTKLGFDFGRAAAQDLEQTRLQYEQFRGQRLSSLGQVLESERQLRGLLGLKAEDGCRLVPSDSPVLAPMKPDWYTALNMTLARRPELLLARQDVKFRQLDLIRLRNNLLPDLRFIATDQLHSVGSQLDGGPTPLNAFHNLVTDPFNNFSLGLQLTVPIGHRNAHAAVRDAQLSLQRSYTSLGIEEDKAERFLALTYRQVLEFQEQTQVQQAALQAASNQLDRYYELFEGGRGKTFGADLILALQNWSNSVASYYAAIVQYNNALATFEFAKGTILERDNVFINEGPLPSCAQVRAVEHERQRTEALVLCDLAKPVTPAGCPAGPEAPVLKSPFLPQDRALSLPVLQQQRPPVPEMPEEAAPLVLPALSVRASPAELEGLRGGR
jgi:outer membrane protein TolC